ncbi:MAG: tol-pal system protein, partial [Pseudomonadota bacterium]
MIRRAAFALLLFAATPLAAQQEETLADIKQELSVIFVDLQRLKQELNTTGFSGGVEGGSVLDRVNAIEARVQALTSKAEELEFR